MNSIIHWINKNFLELRLAIFVFLLIFAPPILHGINLVYVLTAYSICYLLINRRKLSNTVSIKRYLLVFLILFYIAAIYLGIMMIISFNTSPVNIDNYLKTAYKLFLAGVILPINLFYVICRIKMNGLNFWNLIRIIIFAGLIQFCFAILMILFPLVRSYLLDVMFNNNNVDASSIPFWELGRRYYAFSDSVLDTFGLGVGVISVLPVYLFLKNKSKLIFTTPVFLIISIFNSVTGILIFAIGIVPLIPRFLKKVNEICYGRLFLFASLFLIVLVSGIIYSLMPSKFDWVIRESAALLTLGENSKDQITSFSLVFRPTFWQLPPDFISVIFGSGHTVYQAVGFDHSDIGYINNIWLGGLFGSFILYGSFLFLFCSARRVSKDKLVKSMVLFICASFLIFEIKGYGIGYNPGFTVISLIAFSCVDMECDERPLL